ncbi:MAG: hypothetical protein K2Z81_08410, partial [Cyanobacteria bacterium]|nr:hypothetical protein [Cyanobacteriota bacterium]
MNPAAISIFSALVAAAWSVWTWKSERQKEREIKRDEMSAQYVNSLLMVAQELQRLLYRILEEDELAHFKKENPEPCEPASPLAIDLLYYLSQFFGWGLMTFRFGPYTRDPRMISIMAQIGGILESRSQFPEDAFRFTVADRHALGNAVLRCMGEYSSRPVFIAKSRFEFEKEMTDEQSEQARLFQSKAVRCTLAAIDRADTSEALEGRERLVVLQNLLVDLLSYLEQKEGFSVQFRERERARATGASTTTGCLPTMDIRILHQIRGRIRL